MRKYLRLLCALALLPMAGQSQHGCGNGRYESELFSAFTLSSDITYGENINLNNQNTVLKLDFYEPQGDLLPARPLVVLAHGGNFLGGDKAGADVQPIAQSLARSGYAVASINYRVGIPGIPFPGPTDPDIQEAVLRAVHDMKAAVRFFYKDAATTNTYRIDTSMIFVGGASAGAVTALHFAYLDNLAELPSGVDTTQAGLGGGIPGNSGNPGYPEDVKGVINLSGALDEATWLVAGDEPLVSTHARADDVVPYGTGQITFLGIFQLMVVDGSETIDARAQSVGVSSCLYTHEGATVTHVPHQGSATYLDTTMVIIRNFLLEEICNAPATNCQYSVGIGAPVPAFTVQVAPNPSAAGFSVELEGTGAGQWNLEILDLSGKLIYTETGVTDRKLTIDRQGLPAGMYIVRVGLGDSFQTTKAVLY